MKKLYVLLLALAACLTLTACYEAEPAEQQDFWELEEPEPSNTAVEEPAKPAVFTLPYLNSQTFSILCATFFTVSNRAT